MKLNSIILPSIAVLALTSCNAVYEDLDPCPKGAEITAVFSKNMSGVDAFAADVHCPKLYLYNTEGNYVGTYEFDENGHLDMELPAGQYHALAFGGMHCEEADYDFNTDFSEVHHYSTIEAYIRGTRAGAEISRRLHPHFHAVTDFTVNDDDNGHQQITMEFTKNTNKIRTVLAYEDGSAISASYFDFSITADNVATDHANNIIPQGQDATYSPHDFGGDVAEVDGKPSNEAWAEMTIGRLEPTTNAVLHVTRKSDGKSVVDLDLVKYFEKIKGSDLGNVSLQDYLDRQDEWVISFTLDQDTEKLAGLTFKINGWILNLSNTNLEL